MSLQASSLSNFSVFIKNSRTPYENVGPLDGEVKNDRFEIPRENKMQKTAVTIISLTQKGWPYPLGRPDPLLDQHN